MSRVATVNKTTTTFRPLDTTTTLRPARMFCPNCKRAGSSEVVLACLTADKIDFLHCSACGGAWFHEKDMDAVLRATAALDWPAPRPRADDGSEKVAPADNLWSCPCCAGKLVNVHDRRGSGATVRRCLVCYGGWMDHADLVIAAEASKDVLSRLGQMVRSILK